MRLRSLVFFSSFGLVGLIPIACSGGEPRPDPFDFGEGGPGVDGAKVDTGPPETGPDAPASDAGPPATVAHFTTICGTTPCGIMGVKTSGFQELADVSFIVKDSVGTPVPNAMVSFELESPPTGTEFLSGGDGGVGAQTFATKTDDKGVATARVQSGVTLGVFTVVATVAGIQAKSPAIGVRGVTPANRAFKLQCDLKNLAAFADALPPKPLKTNCTATLIDRFNNPVGKAATVNFKVEAGAIPSSSQSKAFDPAGNNDLEGKTSVEFNTVSAVLPLDVPPLAGEPNSGGQNQRDGLVTVLAYVAGEEAFDDNNSNGKWDPGENFIDQGEPFVDRNDDNTWNAGEFYADVPHTLPNGTVVPPNGMWDPPNNVWDKQTTIWTTTWILYSGWVTRSQISEASPYFVGLNTMKQVVASFADDRFNPAQSAPSTTYSFARTGVRGTATPMNQGQLDGYGFGLSRALYDATNSATPCNAGIARCEWLTKFTFTPAFTTGVILQLNGAAAAAGGPENGDSLTFSATVNSVKYDATLIANFE